MISAHPLAELIPPMSEDEYAGLREDVRAHGVREAITVYEGMVLDGRHRARACDELGIEPPMREYDGDDPLGYVVSANLHRRHLSTAQRAMVASRIATMHEGRPVKTVGIPTVSQAAAATMLNVNRSTVVQARRVQERGVPELVAAVDSGRMAMMPAAEIAKREPDDQRAILAGKKPARQEGKEDRAARLTGTQRGKNVATAAHTRLCSICGWLDGLVSGLPRLRLESALAVSTTSDVEQFVESLSGGISALRKLLSTIKEESK